MRLTLLHFNDLHGRLEQLPRLFHLAQRERAAAEAGGRQVLLLEAGDIPDGRRWECQATQGRASFSLLEAMGVQAGVPGNVETLVWGRPGLARLVGAVGFPMLAANLVGDGPAVPGLRGSTLLDLGGFPVGLVGLTQSFPADFAQAGYGLVDPRAALRGEIVGLQAQGARLILLLSHLGLAATPASAAWEPPDALHDDAVAEAFPEIAVILGGHTHSELKSPLQKGNTIIVQAGEHGRYLGRLDLTVDEASGAVLNFAGRLIPCGADVPLDPTIQGTLELVMEEAERVKRRE
jgi:5'-nucleotidase